MTNIRSGIDGAPDDGSAHDLVTSKHMALYEEAANALGGFKAPILVHAGNPHEKLLSRPSMELETTSLQSRIARRTSPKSATRLLLLGGAKFMVSMSRVPEHKGID